MTVQRAYRMTRLATGDYLLPSNDTKTMWRLTRYQDIDGGWYWAAWRWDGAWTPDSLADAIELDDWTRWECWVAPLRTRGEAIAEALSQSDV